MHPRVALVMKSDNGVLVFDLSEHMQQTADLPGV